MRLGQGFGLFGQVAGVAEVRRQVAEVLGEGHTGGDGAGVQAAALDIGQFGLVDDQGDLLQRLRLGLLALELVEQIAAIGQGLHQQAGLAVGIAALDLEFAECQHRVATAEVLQYAMGGCNQFAELAVGEFALAAAEQQHALGLEARQAVQQQGLALLAGDVAALEHGRDGAAAGIIQRLGGGAELAALAEGDDQGGGLQGFRAGAFDEEFHGELSPRQRVGFAG